MKNKEQDPKKTAKIDVVGITGSIKVFITRTNGKKELVFEDKNAIQQDYADIIVDALYAPKDYAMNDLFSSYANPPTEDEDGIAIKDNGSGLWYEMTMAANVLSIGGAADGVSTIKFTGTFTGVGITVADANSVLLGHKWQNAASDFTSIGDAYGAFAKPSTWSSQDVLNTETLTIEWTIKHINA